MYFLLLNCYCWVIVIEYRYIRHAVSFRTNPLQLSEPFSDSTLFIHVQKKKKCE